MSPRDCRRSSCRWTPGIPLAGVNVSVGNTGLDPMDLADLFGGIYAKPRMSTGMAPKQRGSHRIVA